MSPLDKKPHLRVLNVEDSEDDALLVKRHLERQGYDLRFERVDTRASLIKALEAQAWDIIISDYALPNFSAPAALELLKEKGLDLPFIILSGTIGEETAVAAMRAGAHDYLMKDALARLAPAIERELQEARGRAMRQRAEAELLASEQRYRFLAESLPLIVWSARPDGWIDYYNRRWHEYTGMTLEQTRGWGWQRVLHRDDVEQCLRRWTTAVERGKRFEIEYRFRRSSDGAYRWHLGRAVPQYDEEGRIVKWFGTCTDIDDQKRLEEERLQLLAREQEARRVAEAANRTKDEFLAVVSHELRTPLTAVIGWTHLLRSKQLEETASERALETIERNAMAQTQIIDDLLDISRIIVGKLNLDIQPVDLISVAEAAINAIGPAAEAKGIHIQTVFDPSTASVSGDPHRLQQVLGNLLSNAVKFTPEGGRVEVRLTRLDSRMEIKVSDTGKGISPEFLPFVFDRFRQADSTATRAHGGLGLGLAIVRHLVELHGGTVQVESRGEGQGATFTVQLRTWVTREHLSSPVAHTEQVRRRAESSLLITCPPELTDIRVLVVDDEPDALELLTVVLKQCGATVTGAHSVAEAIEVFERVRPHILVSDIGIPDEDGYELIRRVRALEPERGGLTPAVALTAYAREEDRLRTLLAGYQIHLVKPVDPDELMAAVAGLAGRTVKS